MLKENNLRLALEISGRQGYILEAFLEQGLYPELVHMDGEGTLGMTREEALGYTVDVMRGWHELIPGIKFNYLFNFPNHGWKGDHSLTSPGDMGYGDAYDFLVKLEKAARGAGLPLNGITLDNPYNYNYHGKDLEGKAVSGDLLDRAIDAEKEVKALGLEFHLIFNTESSPDELYYRETLSYIDEYEKKGGSPDVYILESWYEKTPSKHLPENEPHTLTYLAAEVLRHVKEGKPIELSGLDLK